MTEKLILATRVVIEVTPDRQIEGTRSDEIVMDSAIRNAKWSGSLTMLKSIFDDNTDVLTIGACHNIKFWSNHEFVGSGPIEIREIRPRANGLGQATIDLQFEGTKEPELVME